MRDKDYAKNTFKDGRCRASPKRHSIPKVTGTEGGQLILIQMEITRRSNQDETKRKIYITELKFPIFIFRTKLFKIFWSSLS